MKPYQARILLPLLILSQQAMAADLCEINKSTLESNLSKVETTVDEIVEAKLPSATKASLIADLAPKFATFVDVVGKVGAVAGVGIGAYEILDGVKAHDSSKIIDGSLNIATVVAPEIVSTVVGEVVGEAVGGIAGGAAAFLAVEGLNIYNGVKADKILSSIKDQNAKLADVYAANVIALEKGLADSRKIIAGDSDELYTITTKNFSTLSLELTKRSIDKLAAPLYQRELGIKALQLSATNHDANPLSKLESGVAIDKTLLMAQLSAMTSNLNWWYSLENTKGELELRYVPGTPSPSQYYISNNYYWNTGQSLWGKGDALAHTLTPMLNSKAAQQHYSPLFKWSRGSLEPIIDKLIDRTFDDKDSLARDYQLVFEEVLHNFPKIQEQMLEQYNLIITQKYSWLKLGHELMADLDYSDEKLKRDLVWAFRVLDPIVESFAESKLDEELIDSINVSYMVTSIITHLINQGMDITQPSSYNKVKKLFSNDGAPKAITAIFEKAFTAARQAATSRVMVKSSIKPVQLNQTVIAEHKAATQKLIDDGTLKRMLDGAINNHLKDKVYLQRFTKEYSANVFQAASKIHWGYNKKVISIINNYLKLIKQVDVNDKQKMVDLLYDMEFELIANYSRFKKKNIHIDPNNKWVNFNTLPHPKSELTSIRKFVRNSTKNL